jgi:hypothetical protein
MCVSTSTPVRHTHACNSGQYNEKKKVDHERKRKGAHDRGETPCIHVKVASIGRWMWSHRLMHIWAYRTYGNAYIHTNTRDPSKARQCM